MAWRLAKSLAVLRDQVNLLAPNRGKSDDGTIGDDSHLHDHPTSDHNPNGAGVVCAIDFTHDPSGGFDSYKFAEVLRNARDSRIQYVISNGRIWNATVSPYLWRAYTGANKHDRHVHISVKQNAALYDKETNWLLFAPMPTPASWTAKGSWYSQYKGKYNWVDTGDAPGSSALGVPDDQQGFALPERATLGQWRDVTAPNGKTLKLQQTDLGPAKWTGRGIDIAAVAAERFGYSPSSFPNNGVFSWRPVSDTPPEPSKPLTGTKWVQSRLNLIMIANSDDPDNLILLDVDGDYGEVTRAGVADFQRWVGLPITGELDDTTLSTMDAELAEIK
jgi:peptidoglycan hydrolase-like protein with peptidoglycan-binding domain